MKRSKFSLSHYRLSTMDMGKLYPIAVFDALPGDTIQQATTALIRMQPMLAPVMHPIQVKIHHWFVPYRLIWDSFEDFITGESTPEFPTIKKDFTKGSLGDHMGLFGNQEVSALPFRAYQLIWNNFYRDQDLQSELTDTSEDGLDTETNTNLLPVSWEKDYFTTARPWTQKGSEISIPVGGSFSNATLTGPFPRVDAFFGSESGASLTPFSVNEIGGNSLFTASKHLGPDTNPFVPPFYSSKGGSLDSAFYDPNSSTGRLMIGDLSTSGNSQESQSAVGFEFNNMSRSNFGDPNSSISGVSGKIDLNSGISINELRLALALQRYEEARAKYGSRYVEYLRYLGIRSSDARLQLPEYLGGGKQIIQISEVLNTSGQGVLGEMGGHGLTAMRSNRYRRFFEEHGVVLSLMYIMPKPMYVEGTHRNWLKRTKEDFFQKELQHIGMQEVFTRELKGTAPNDSIFGYQDRYDEYRRHPSGIAGDFRDTLDFWHLGRTFDNNPVLNADFISKEPTKRIFAEQTQNEFLIMASHSIQARRMLSKVAKTATF